MAHPQFAAKLMMSAVQHPNRDAHRLARRVDHT